MIIGLDVGDKRVGVACSDPSGKMALSRGAWERTNGLAERELVNLILAEGVTMVVVGLPVGENKEKNAQCERVERFCRRLLRRVPVMLVYVDEYASTQEALERLQAAGSSRRVAKRKNGVVDALSASIILQSYLDSHPRRGYSL